MNFGSFFDPFNIVGGATNTKNPADNANEYLNQIPGLYEPMQQFYQGLSQNPGQQVNNIGQDFQQSPGYQFSLQQALNANKGNLASRGMLHTPQAEQEQMGLATNLANQDYYNWLQQAMGVFNTGVGGQQNILDTLGGNLQSQASNAFSGQQGKNDYKQALIGALLGFGGSMARGGATSSPFATPAGR